MSIKKEEIGCLVSRNKYSVCVDYGDTKILIPPQGRTANDVVKRLLGKLPENVTFVIKK